jgi:hypothetical protein
MGAAPPTAMPPTRTVAVVRRSGFMGVL